MYCAYKVELVLVTWDLSTENIGMYRLITGQEEYQSLWTSSQSFPLWLKFALEPTNYQKEGRVWVQERVERFWIIRIFLSVFNPS